MIPDTDFQHRRRGRRGFFPLVGGVMALAFGGVVMLLWNAILPELLHVNRITYWQAVGLLVLCRILFGNFGRGMGGGWQQNNKEQMRGFGGMREKWMRMTPEERQAFKEQWRNRCDRGKWGRGNRDSAS